MIDAILEQLGEEQFITGLRWGVAALLVGAVAGLVALGLRRGRRVPLPVVGLLGAGAAWAALDELSLASSALALGLVALGAAGVVADVVPRARALLPLLALPGAWVLSTQAVDVAGWAVFALLATVVIGGPLVADVDHHWRHRPLAPALVAVSILGVYATVPETDHVIAVVGAVLPLALLGWPVGLGRLGAAGSLALTGLLAWSVAVGGVTRPSSIVGGLACLGFLAAEPVGRFLVARRDPGLRAVPGPGAVVLAGLAHLVVVATASRVAGLRDSATVAALIVSIDLVLALALSGGLAAWTSRATRPS